MDSAQYAARLIRVGEKGCVDPYFMWIIATRTGTSVDYCVIHAMLG